MVDSIIGMGASCFVWHAGKNTVIKGYEIWANGKKRSYYPRPCEEALYREEFMYTCLGEEHPRVLRCFGLEEVHPGVRSLRLELAPLGNVRQFIQKCSEHPLSQQVRLQMSLDIATGLSYVHSKKIRHSDLSCRNLFLFENHRVKIGDFGGFTIEGYEFAETVCEEAQYELPCRGREFQKRPVIKRELFALGSAVYEVMAWMRPFEGLADEEVEARYAREEFPSLDGITIGQIILNCWNEMYENADAVVASFREQLLLDGGAADENIK